MWPGVTLRSAGARLLGATGCRGSRGRSAPAAASAVYSENQISRTSHNKPWIDSACGSMYFRPSRMTSACLKGVRAHRLLWTRLHSASRSSVDREGLKVFLALAHKWWDEQGVYAPLHSMNALRVPFIRDNLLKAVASHQPGIPLSGMKILDVGCGGGLLSEPLGRLGASVLGIDPVEENIKTAQHHRTFDPVLDQRVEYRVCSLEGIVQESAETFDAVVASEVVEHVPDLETFIQCCCQVLKPGGSLFITTINRTQLSYALGIVFAEQIAHIVPKGTHTWEKFVSPEKLESILESNGLSAQTIVGMLYNPFSGRWRWTENTSLNYAAHAVKCKAQEREAPVPSACKGEEAGARAEASASGAVLES
ncbi:ubiquinone biosynthesis O-methyltransferase, mitochondrial [Erinaceus europaeus]|uniref:Ubiquinone biosynthesis O-methyltransferase, mitochondrial n=1 Tax=Erinaceus europaeus TaxID=9365 RepID=A0ABM3XD13_ERIEU|nr:ubiquinone biosynthesis O-methyltransferase, mitochondrial [Erinaceus europaeus]